MVKDTFDPDICLKQCFPNLRSDNYYKATSPRDFNYNCIAWAMRLNDRWVEPDLAAGRWWPYEYTNRKDEYTPNSLIKAFEAVGYKECNDSKRQFGYDKVALYRHTIDDRWTHAARIINEHEFHSKAGEIWDFHHDSDKYRLHNKYDIQKSYGEIYAYMKRPKLLRLYSSYLRLKLFLIKIINEVRYC